MKRATLVLLALLALAACGGGDDEEATSTTATVKAADGVRTLDNILALRSDFEADAGKTRVVLLLSPT